MEVTHSKARSLMTKENAIRATRNGAIAAFVSAALTFIVVLFAVISGPDGDLALFNDPINLLDVVLIVACAIGMLRRSRAAAITVFVYFLVSRISIVAETGNVVSALAGLIFIYFYGKAIHGAYSYHELKAQEDPEYRPAPKWSYYLGIPVIAVFFLLMIAGMVVDTDDTPSTAVVRGTSISAVNWELLVENGVLFDDEVVDYFYSYGVNSVLEGGSILTDRSVTMYFVDDEEELQIYEFMFTEIESIELVEQGDFWNDSTYRVVGLGENNWLNITLSVENNGDVNFIRALRRKITTSARGFRTE